MLIGSNLFGYVKEPLNLVFRSTADAVGECATRNLAQVLARESEMSVFWHEGDLANRTPGAQYSSPYWSEYAAGGFLRVPDSAIAVAQTH